MAEILFFIHNLFCDLQNIRQYLLSSLLPNSARLSQSVEMLQVVTFSSLALLLSGVTSQQCIDFTTKDVEGPFFVSNVPLKVGCHGEHFVLHPLICLSQYKVAPDADIQEPSQGAIIRGRVR